MLVAISYYVEDQNSPSPIEAQLVRLPDDYEESVKILTRMFLDYFDLKSSTGKKITVTKDKDSHFGRHDSTYKGYDLTWLDCGMFARVVELPD